MMVEFGYHRPMTTLKPGAGVQRIDYSVAERMLRAGATQREVADHFGVTQPAVNRAIWRGRIKDITYDRATKDESGIPWHPIMSEHRSRYLIRMLRAAARRQRGEKSAPVIEAQLDSFLEQLHQHDFVIHYEPRSEEGFFRVPRREGIDTGYVRDPYVDDNGNRIPNPKGVWRQDRDEDK